MAKRANPTTTSVAAATSANRTAMSRRIPGVPTAAQTSAVARVCPSDCPSYWDKRKSPVASRCFTTGCDGRQEPKRRGQESSKASPQVLSRIRFAATTLTAAIICVCAPVLASGRVFSPFVTCFVPLGQTPSEFPIAGEAELLRCGRLPSARYGRPHSRLAGLGSEGLQAVLAKRLHGEEQSVGSSLSRETQARIAQTVWRDAGAVKPDAIRNSFIKITLAAGS